MDRIELQTIEKKMKNKLIIETVVSIIFFLLILVFVNTVLSQESKDQPSFNVCCEKTKSGAWCQNTLEENCAENFRKTPTSCDATSFCKLGVCVDTSEGLCMENTPQKVCEISKGTWFDNEREELSQCSLGCCILGDQASFVTLTRCKRLSRIYGLDTNFKRDITDEVQCILIAHAADKGACVFEIDGEKSCKFTTRQECSNSLQSSNLLQGNITAQTEFFKDYLCTADELATNCGPTTETICVDGKDEVYFKDTCGNPTNIYDTNRIYSKDPGYWRRVVPKIESCNADKGNINSKTCGNCNYLQGSICGKGNAQFGNNICKDLNCYNTKNGNNYRNGESWCESISAGGNGDDAVGNRYFRHVCIQGEEIIEPCADFRNEVCIENSFDTSYGNFNEAACRVNRWTDCIDQFTERDCQNTDKRDCIWVKGLHYDGTSSKQEIKNIANQELDNKNKGILKGGFICLPKYPPGLEFWNDKNARQICSLGNSRQVVEYEENIFGKKKCKENCEVTEKSWVDTMNRACINLGDCGAYININNVYTDFGVVWKQNGKRKNIQTGLLEDVRESAEQTEIKNENTVTNERAGFNAEPQGNESVFNE